MKMEVLISEDNRDTLQAFTIRASRKWLRRMKAVAAHNVAQNIKCDNDVDFLQIPNSFTKLVRQFVITFFGDYILDLMENWNKGDNKAGFYISMLPSHNRCTHWRSAW